jgi:hypothetical protein
VRTCAEATISLCARVVITLVSSTLRDTSFKYTTWYSFNNSDRSSPIRSPLDTMDATDEQAERMLRASESQDTPIEEEQRQDELEDMVQDVAEEERARRVRRRRDML